ncbi:MAG: ferritin-like domain-containing protein [Alphaproteobacteria bacterium]|nr:ferritin-like domain-containing protein [Alphaproteobacteria bacterium]MDE1969599.1 ferritin-like domain-containing protein [Alphaproteobacteria bacterium]
MDAIRYSDIARDAVEDDALLFQIVASASFIEITSDLYTENLIEYFRDDPELVDWLAQHWEPEELQHGAALKRYVETAWPEFDWQRAYAGFFAEYSRCCSLENLAPTRALEMVARCVVETGTASFYRMLAEAAPEPILHQIASNIAADEVRHYKNFYYFFRRYRASEHPGRTAVLKTLWDRAQEVDTEDAYIAFKHVFRVSNPEAEFQPADYETFRTGVRRMGREYFPYGMALKMFLKPLGLAPAIGRMVLPSAAAATRFLILR